MQFKFEEYDAERHDLFKALTVKQPWASSLLRRYKTIEGVDFAEKSVELRKRPTKYRGDVLICSSKTPVISYLDCGASIGLVELYDIKPVAEFTAEDWENSMIKESKGMKEYSFGWFMRNPRRVIEFPVSGNLGLWNLVYTKDTIIEYPRIVTF